MKKFAVFVLFLSLCVWAAVTFSVDSKHPGEEALAKNRTLRKTIVRPVRVPQVRQGPAAPGCSVYIRAEGEGSVPLASFRMCFLTHDEKLENCEVSSGERSIEIPCLSAKKAMVSSPGYLGRMIIIHGKKDVNVRLVPCAYSIAGQVKDVFGGPIGGARVWNQWSVRETQETGHFRLCVPTKGLHKMSAGHTGYETWGGFTFGIREDVKVFLDPSQEDSSKENIVAYEIAIVDENSGPVFDCTATGLSGASVRSESGIMSMRSKARDESYFKIRCPGFATKSIVIDVVDEMAPVTVVLRLPSAVVLGTVKDQNGVPVKDGEVTAYWGESEYTSSKIDTSGTYRMTDVPAGRELRLEASEVDSISPAARILTVGSGESVVVDFVLSTGFRISGKITGVGVWPAFVHLYNLNTLAGKSRQVSPTGEFEVTGLIDDEYRVSASREGGPNLELKGTDQNPVFVSSGETNRERVVLSMNDKAVVLQGIVVDEEGESVGGAIVLARLDISYYMEPVEADALGKFTLNVPTMSKVSVSARDMEGRRGRKMIAADRIDQRAVIEISD